MLFQSSCRIERRLDRDLEEPPPLVGLPDDAVHILLVTARPYEDDVDYRSISRPLVELVAAERLPARVHVLRPPTLGALRAHLHENPGRYHILHFDGHGGYGTASASAGTASPGGHLFHGAEGRLVFEADDGSPDPVIATTLGALLREHRVPVVVLNACQSAMVDGDAANQFASVATALLHGGARSVVAMAYSLYVSGGQQFLPAFYRRLFETSSVAEATRAGRQQMYAERERTCARDQQELHDWLVPVLYQHGDERGSASASLGFWFVSRTCRRQFTVWCHIAGLVHFARAQKTATPSPFRATRRPGLEGGARDRNRSTRRLS